MPVQSLTDSTISGALADVVEARSDRPCLLDASGALTYAQFWRYLARAWRLLSREGVKAGDFVAITGHNSVDLVVWIYAAMVHGAVAMPLRPQWTADELGTLLAHAPAAVWITDREGAGKITAIPVFPLNAYRSDATRGTPSVRGCVDPSAPCLLVYTSGTTGSPKGVLLRHENVMSNVRSIKTFFDFGPDHRTLCLLPLYHLFGLISDVSTMLLVGGSCVVFPEFGPAAVPALEQSIRRHHVTSLSGVPLVYDILTRLPFEMAGGSLKFCVSGAAPLEPAVANRFANRHGVPLVPGYGLSETTCYASCNPTSSIRYGSIGKDEPFDEIRIVDDAGLELPPRAVGELAIAGPNVMNGGYHRSPDPVFHPALPDFLSTGDLGYRDPEGYIFLVGRKRNMVIRGGEKVYLEDIDQLLTQIEDLAECVSVRAGSRDRELVVTFAVRRPGSEASERSVMAFLRERLGARRCPDAIRFLDRIPRTPTQKPMIGRLQVLADELLS